MSVTSRAISAKAGGKVVFISPLVDKETRTARVIAEIENSDGFWRPGSFVTAAIAFEEQTVPLVVPASAIQTLGNEQVAFIRTEEGFARRRLVLGESDDCAIEVLSGFSAGRNHCREKCFSLKAEFPKSKAEIDREMLEHIITFSIRRGWLILLLILAAALSGFCSLRRLPVDAVPDITNVHVQVNAFAPAQSPLEIEKPVRFPIEVALSGTPGLESTPPRGNDRTRRLTGIHSNGGCHWHRWRGSETAGDRRHWWADHRHHLDASRARGPLCPIFASADQGHRSLIGWPSNARHPAGEGR